jgi:hypothetical protein
MDVSRNSADSIERGRGVLGIFYVSSKKDNNYNNIDITLM